MKKLLLLSVFAFMLAGCQNYDVATHPDELSDRAELGGKIVPTLPVPGTATLAMFPINYLAPAHGQVELRVFYLPEHVVGWSWSLGSAQGNMVISSQSVDRVVYTLNYPVNNHPTSVIIYYHYKVCNDDTWYYITKLVDYLPEAV